MALICYRVTGGRVDVEEVDSVSSSNEVDGDFAALSDESDEEFEVSSDVPFDYNSSSSSSDDDDDNSLITPTGSTADDDVPDLDDLWPRSEDDVGPLLTKEFGNTS